MNRQLALLAFAVGALHRHLRRTVTLGAALAFTVAMVASALMLTDALRAEYAAVASTSPDLTVQRLVAGRPALIDVTVATKVREIPGVVSVRPRVWGYYFIPSLQGNLTVVGVDPRRSDVRRDLGRIVRGRGMRAGGRGEMVLGDALATFLGTQIGDEIGLPGEGGRPVFLTTVGFFEAQSALWTADALVTSEADARRLLRVPDGHATDLAVRLSTPDEASVVTRKVSELLPDARIIERRLLARTYELTFSERGGLLLAALLPALAAMLVLAWDRMTGLGAAERREIGILKSLGWSTADLLAAKVWEATLLGVLATVLGVGAAYVYVFLAEAPGLSDVLLGWSSFYPPLDLRPTVTGTQVLTIVSASVVPFVALSVVPAWRAASADPDSALRGT
ncbi:MAG: FtsX-like permease family protein [Deltaproteobacteria bacterium]|nr:FtsX-like permease family protein [Deltaproteobacteria bacterium]